ncbi:MAG: hypothetical protein AB7G28_25405 [Pirellulales bacterium]
MSTSIAIAPVVMPPTDPPLSASHHQALAAASGRAEPIRRACRVATFNAWTTAVLAALSAPFALFSLAGLAVFAGLAAVAWNEFRGRERLRQFDPAGASILGWNQLGLLALITVYCLWAIYSNLWGSESIDAQLRANPELKAAFGSLDGLSQMVEPIVLAFYGLVIALSTLFQGGNALYYFTRRKYVETYVRETPEWVIDLQRATS